MSDDPKMFTSLHCDIQHNAHRLCRYQTLANLGFWVRLIGRMIERPARLAASKPCDVPIFVGRAVLYAIAVKGAFGPLERVSIQLGDTTCCLLVLVAFPAVAASQQVRLSDVLRLTCLDRYLSPCLESRIGQTCLNGSPNLR